MTDSDPASSDTDADADADTIETTTAGLSPRWWRNRRRWFYLIVTAVPIALLWGGWSWWYRANFPMPPLGWLEKVGIDVDPVGWELEMQTWKIRRETRRLRLEGTVWRSGLSHKATLEFGRDGRIRLPHLGVFIEKLSLLRGSAGSPPLGFGERRALARFEGAPYRFDGAAYRTPARPNRHWYWPESPNLEVEGSAWKLRMVYDGENLHLNFRVPDTGEPFSERDWSVLLRKVEAGARSPR